MPAPSSSRHRAAPTLDPSSAALRAPAPARGTFSALQHRLPLASTDWRTRPPWTPTPSASRHRAAPTLDPSPAALRAPVPAAGTFSALQHRLPLASTDWRTRPPWTPTPSASRHRVAPTPSPSPAALRAPAPARGTFSALQHRLPLASTDWRTRPPWTPTPSASRHRVAPSRDPSPAALRAPAPAAARFSVRLPRLPPLP